MKVVRNVGKGVREDLRRTILNMIEFCNADPLGASGYEVTQNRVKIKKLSSTQYRTTFYDSFGEAKLIINSDQHGNITQQENLTKQTDFTLPKPEQMMMLECIHRTQNMSQDKQNEAIREEFPELNAKQRSKRRGRLEQRGYIERGKIGTFITTEVGDSAIGIWRKYQDHLNKTPEL